jgi:hypothetical protein
VGSDRKLRAGIAAAARIPHDDRGVHARRATGALDTTRSPPKHRARGSRPRMLPPREGCRHRAWKK